MKTPMQELIELINKRDYISNFVIRDKAIKLLEKEKEQIVKAWEDGDYAYFYSKETGRDFDNGEDYFYEKYKK